MAYRWCGGPAAVPRSREEAAVLRRPAAGPSPRRGHAGVAASGWWPSRAEAEARPPWPPARGWAANHPARGPEGAAPAPVGGSIGRLAHGGGLGQLRADNRDHLPDMAALLARRGGRHRNTLDHRLGAGRRLTYLEHLPAIRTGTAHLPPAQRRVHPPLGIAMGTDGEDVHGFVPPKVADGARPGRFIVIGFGPQRNGGMAACVLVTRAGRPAASNGLSAHTPRGPIPRFSRAAANTPARCSAPPSIPSALISRK